MGYRTTTQSSWIGESGRNLGTVYAEDGQPMRGYRVPDLVGLTVAQATYEWTHRLGRRDVRWDNPYNATYGSGQTRTETWEGFTGGVKAFGLPADAVVSAVTTDPAANPGDSLPPSASVELVAAGTYYLVTHSGDPLVTPGGDRLYVEIT